ncbi:hypothetical protein FCN77_12830 [Arthrobacter sp. 24S4-2]|uniref:hypothetical protein n=1 Tax=unclassified Arthrobacter TaxID=235627 RepID=UPI0010C7C3B0|nr:MULTISPECIES: hypothetical protein [unclassified Arthrobacter]MCB5293155.1 hypothetical protein [Arthrobacter sp. SO3]QCO98411.1 hypothetical protein FCN77_12830 [Arthrobacter sp. 24S4-2]
MNCGEWVLRFCAALMPTASRDRYREEWLADARHAHELSMSASAVVRGAARTTLNAQKDGILMSSTFSPRQLTVRGAFAVIVSIALFITGILIRFPEGALALWALGTVIAVTGSALLARAASSALGSGRVPWTLFFTAAACPLVLLIGVIEVNWHFNVVDSRIQSGGQPGLADSLSFVVMLITGAAGVTAFLASIVLGIVLVVKLAKAHTSHGPRGLAIN